MKPKTFITIAGTIFGAIALLHLLRILAGWPVHVGTGEVPMWLSWVSVLVAGYLSFSAFRLQR